MMAAVAGRAGGGEPTRLGVFGGTFDPIHWGHLLVAEDVRVALELTQVLFVPVHTPPQKSARPLATPEQRYDMVALAIRGNPTFAVSRVELDRGGVSYAVDTLTLLREQIGPGGQLFVIMGSDIARGLTSWRDAARLLTLATFVAVERPGVPAGALPPGVVRVTTTPVGISSSDVRGRLRAGQTARYLVPDSVLEYIQRKGLYEIVLRERRARSESVSS